MKEWVVSVFSLAQTFFVCAKCTGLIDWPWLAVLSPLLVTSVFWVLFLMYAGLVVAIIKEGRKHV